MEFFEACGSFIVEHPIPVLAALVILNVLSFCLYLADKIKAKRGLWRIPESTLILSAWLFGGLGAVAGMYIVRHKTKHIKFVILVPLAFVVQAIFLILSLSALLF